MIDVGIVGVGTYLPEKTMKAAEIARLTNGVWSEDAVINKLGIKQRYLPGPDDGTQEIQENPVVQEAYLGTNEVKKEAQNG